MLTSAQGERVFSYRFTTNEDFEKLKTCDVGNGTLAYNMKTQEIWMYDEEENDWIKQC